MNKIAYSDEYGINTTLYIGKKDSDIYDWVYSIPNGMFSRTMRELYKAYRSGTENYNVVDALVSGYYDKNRITPNENKKYPLRKGFCCPREDENYYLFEEMLNSTMLGYRLKSVIRHYLFSREPSKTDTQIDSKPVQVEEAVVVENLVDNNVLENESVIKNDIETISKGYDNPLDVQAIISSVSMENIIQSNTGNAKNEADVEDEELSFLTNKLFESRKKKK